MGKIFAAIDAQIIKPRTTASEEDGFKATKDDISSFYSQGDPSSYKRTYAYENSPRSTGVSGGDGDYDYSIYLEDPDYYSKVFTSHEIMEAIQYKGLGILGRAGTWFEAEEDIKEAIRNHFN